MFMKIFKKSLGCKSHKTLTMLKSLTFDNLQQITWKSCMQSLDFSKISKNTALIFAAVETLIKYSILS